MVSQAVGNQAQIKEGKTQSAAVVQEACKPFLRWAGGKRWLARSLAPILRRHLDTSGGTYIEPFLGSGAIFYATAPARAILNDLNEDLVLAHAAVADVPDYLVKALASLPVDRETYNAVRELAPKSPFERAVRMIWLNRTCYGGIHRTNKQGQFNTPYGGGSRRPDVLWREGIVEGCAQVLSGDIDLTVGDFEAAIDRAGDGDVVFCDPTYSNPNRDHFDRYGPSVFSWADQVRLSSACRRALGRGATVIVTNGAYSQLAEIYPDAYRITLKRATSMGVRRKAGTDDEYLFILDPWKRRRKWAGLGEIENRLKQAAEASRVSALSEARRPKVQAPRAIVRPIEPVLD
ncbi:Dam family site-specific DNA-(adenine-N6)-methyltransferase [Leisingera daeponensis]|uniref:site-specific DNA-methyltransferase (adenine-specific) n=1 Tax=Leisingera daeponensis TaxID=405746 RepID=A0ABS7NLK8_9RHOB|nr:Dam family site-specific DNA-(adenine-N6)-methyltransferase [Leisingera daeponensis]MBY6142067.1 Dam family site-specific DNA-(adenine-N6)-methyltransferase [Leisingera daeponensis]